MDTLPLDVPLLIGVLIALVLSRILTRKATFLSLCFAASTILAQYSLVVNWSLDRLVPIITATAPRSRKSLLTTALIPFFVYAFISTLALSMSWDVPPELPAAYGRYRFVIQLVNLTFLALATSALACGLSDEETPRKLYDAFTGLMLLHGGASLYQMTAVRTGLPVIGISRAHMDEINVASFAAGADTITRPGGLAGEPKTAAVIFGTYLILATFGRLRGERSTLRKTIETIAVVLAGFGFLAAFSTSAFLGLPLAVVLLAMRIPRRFDRNTLRFAVPVAIALVVWPLASGYSGSLESLLEMRTTQRMAGQEEAALDPPVQIMLDRMAEDPVTLSVGTGLGGSSFVVMNKMPMDATSFAPNVTAVLLLSETGVIGTLLLLGPMLYFFFKRPSTPFRSDEEADLYLALAAGALCLQLTGSGTTFGFPIAIAAIAAIHSPVSVPASVRRSGQLQRLKAPVSPA